MLQALNLPPKFAVALDPDFIRATVERASGMRLTRRTCRPLESLRSRSVEIETAEFDSLIDAEVIPGDEIPADSAPSIDL